MLTLGLILQRTRVAAVGFALSLPFLAYVGMNPPPFRYYCLYCVTASGLALVANYLALVTNHLRWRLAAGLLAVPSIILMGYMAIIVLAHM